MLNQIEVNNIVRALIFRINSLQSLVASTNNASLVTDFVEEITTLEKLIKKLYGLETLKLRDFYRSICKEEGYIACIKQYRKDSGLGLKESKDTIDCWIEEFDWERKVWS